MLKKNKLLILLLLIPFLFVGFVGAATKLFPYQGGTGTTSVPTEDQLLIGTSGGVYTPSSTLGFGTRLTAIYTTLLDTTNIAIGGVSTGNIDMDGNWIINTGRHGIGEPTPDGLLEIVSDGLNAPFMISDGADGDGDIFIVDSSGNVGIGTTSPTDPLHVKGTGAGIAGRTAITIENTQTDSAAMIRLTNDAGRWASFQYSGSAYVVGELFGIATQEDYPIIFATNGQNASGGSSYISYSPGGHTNESVRFLANGNVGIGDTSPDAALEVTTNSAGDLFYISTDSTVDGDVMKVDSLGDINFDSGTMFVDNSTNRVGIGTTSPNEKLEVVGDAYITDDLHLGDILFFGSRDNNTYINYIATDNLDFVAGGNSAVYLKSDGNVGIGDTDPDSTLEVVSSSGTAPFMISDGAGGDGDIFIVDSSGNVSIDDGNLFWDNVNKRLGVGTSSPDRVLHLASNLQNDTRFVLSESGDTADNHYSGFEIRDGGAFKGGIFKNGVSHDLSFWTTSKRMTILAGGNVGIGDTSPDYKLEVLAVTTQLALTHTDGVDEAHFVVDSDGNLTIVPTGGNMIVEGYIRPTVIWHVYGGFQDADETIDLSSTDWEMITNGTDDLWVGLETDGFSLTNDIMTITNEGDYFGSLSITMSGGNTKDYIIRLYNITQSSQVAYVLSGTGTGNTNFFNVSLPLYIENTAGDTYRMEVKSSDGTDVIMRSAVFFINYLHE